MPLKGPWYHSETPQENAHIDKSSDRAKGEQRIMYLVMFVCCWLFSWRYNPSGCIFHRPVAGFSLLVFRGFLITNNDASQSVGLLWASDQSVAETST